MKKLITPLAIALTFLTCKTADADILFLKNGALKGNLNNPKVIVKFPSIDYSENLLKENDVIGFMIHNNGSIQVNYSTEDEYFASPEYDLNNVEITFEDKEGNIESVKANNVKKYLITNDVVPDEKIIQKYQFIEEINNYCKKIGLKTGTFGFDGTIYFSTFYFYNDQIEPVYSLSAVKNLELAEDYTNFEKIYRKSSSDKKELEILEKKLNGEGFDTCISTSVSLGSELAPTLVEENIAKFTMILFHERWHESSGRKCSPCLEESIASAIGYSCAEQFLLEKYGESSKELNMLRQFKEEFDKKSEIFLDCYTNLSELYTKEISDKEKLRMKKRILEEVENTADMKLNNAILSIHIAYAKYYKLANEVIKNSKDLKEAITSLIKVNSFYNRDEKSVEYLKSLLGE